MDAIFMLERSINGSSPAERVSARRRDIAPLVGDLIDWMKWERAKFSRHNEVAKAMDYMLKRIDVFTRFLDDGRICLSNNAGERDCDDRVILHPLFKCLETLMSVFRNRPDTGDLFA